MHADEPTYTGFVGQRRVASGDLVTVALKVQAATEKDPAATPTVIDDLTGESVSLNLHGTPEQLRARLERRLARTSAETEPEKRAGPGRPRLGVVSREVSLLPRHWDWLGEQPGGASAALRRLVEEARRDNQAKDRARRARDAAYTFMAVMAGDLPDFEEAARALYAGDAARLERLVRAWPRDVREHALKLADVARERAAEAEAAEARKRARGTSRE